MLLIGTDRLDLRRRVARGSTEVEWVGFVSKARRGFNGQESDGLEGGVWENFERVSCPFVCWCVESWH